MDVNLKVLENPGYDDSLISFDASTERFRDSGGEAISRADINALSAATNLGARAHAGGKTIARAAILRALLRESSGESQGARGRDGILARLAKLASDRSQATDGLFSRGSEQGASSS